MADPAPDPGIQLPDPAPTEETQIPASMLGMGGQGIDSFSSALRGKAEKILPDVMRAADQTEKDKGTAALAEAQQIDKYRQQMADIYKNYKPDTVDFGGQPNQPEQNPIKQFGSMASMLGIFASAFTKKPITNALNASAAAMNAARAGDMEAYKNSYQAWQDHIKDAVKKNELDHKFLDEKLEEAKDDNASALAEIKAYAVANDWPAASVLAQAGDLEGLARLVKSLEVAGNKTANFKTFIAQQGIQEFIQKNGRLPNYKELADINKTAEGKDTDAGLAPDAVDDTAMAYAITGNMPSLGMGGAKDREAIINKAAQIRRDAGITVQDQLSGRAAYKADALSLNKLTPQYDAITAFEGTAKSNMENALRLMNKGSGTAAGPVINRWLQAGRRETGDPDVKAFNAALYTASTEYAKVMSGAVNNQSLTDSARKEAEDKIVDAIDSPEAIQKVYQEVMLPDMNNRRNSLETQISDIKNRINSVGGALTPGSAPKSKPIEELPEGSIYQGIDQKTKKKVYKTPDGSLLLEDQ